MKADNNECMNLGGECTCVSTAACEIRGKQCARLLGDTGDKTSTTEQSLEQE